MQAQGCTEKLVTNGVPAEHCAPQRWTLRAYQRVQNLLLRVGVQAVSSCFRIRLHLLCMLWLPMQPREAVPRSLHAHSDP